jgi:hypothetical protein
MADLVLTPAEIAWIINDIDGHRLVRYPALNQRFSRDNKVTALAVVLAESGGNVDKKAGAKFGLAQIDMSGGQGTTRRAMFGLGTNEELTNPHVNLRVMAVLSVSGNNFGKWTTFAKGTYRQHMNTATDAFKKPVNPTKKIAAHDDQLAQEEWDEKGPGEQIMEWFGHGLYRVGLFVGGGVLIISAVVLAAKKGIK